MSDDSQYGYVNPQDGITYYYGGDLTPACTVGKCPIEFSVYGYRPSLAFSGAVIGLYAIVMVLQTYLGVRYRKWGFMTAMLFGCICEILGYVGRIMYWSNPWGESGFIMQIVLITLAPVFFSAAIYVLIYLIVCYIDPTKSRFSPKFFYWIFISADIISLILQATGGAMSSTSNGSSDAGVNIALAGLAFQVATITIFCIAVADYMWRSRSVWGSVKLPFRFVNFCGWLTAAIIFIQIRCCYRVYELSEGYSRDSEALRDEPLFIALEGVMVIIAAFCLVAGHPGFVFKDGMTLAKATGQNAYLEPKAVRSSSGEDMT